MGVSGVKRKNTNEYIVWVCARIIETPLVIFYALKRLVSNHEIVRDIGS